MLHITRSRAATLGLLAPASLALAMSADTSYRFLKTALDITDHTERVLLCGVAESAIVALTVYAWATRTKGPAYLAYAAVLVQAIPAFQVSGATGGPVRVVLGPVLLAVMLHLLLGLELRMSGEKSDGILAAALREVRERLTASLGIGRRGADSAAIARSRAADRAVDLADRVAGATEGTRRRTRRAAKLAAAIDAARHGLSPTDADAAEAAIVARVVRRKSVAGLATIATRHDWTATLPAPRHDRDTTATADRDTATTPVPTDRDTDRVTATSTATPAATPDRDTATTPVPTGAMDRDTAMGHPDTEADSQVPAVVDLMTKRHTATSREQGSDLAVRSASVAGDTAATITVPGPSELPESDAAPSVAQMVREAMTAGVTDRDMILSRVQQYRPTTTRQTVAKAMQRQAAKTPQPVAGNGPYL
ncbi:hypothetical protein [Streptomyces mirabilis]|uniref:hypothetical protein n=1 Tax=Streptomyces mirabilis TaxID=68239 RepID=UPI002254FDD6|nr:hypothetical protein [Streptomyces mirabilis]MCX4429460.1 hypothetical protein [Streptomyces mirabilis]